MDKAILSCLTILLTLLSHQTYCLPSCPPPNIDITPCQCLDGQTNKPQGETGIQEVASAIRCFGSQPLDLANIFEILDANIAPGNKKFDLFYINNTFIKEIPENVFKDFTFEEIYFDRTKKLSKIDANAFGGSSTTAFGLHAWDTGLDISAANSNNIKSFDSLKNLRFLDFSTTDCPPQELLGDSCKCGKSKEFEKISYESPIIVCQHLSNNEELVQIFQKLGSNLKNSKRNFLRLEILDSHITQLPENIFNGISFSEIVIEENPKLSLIHKNVFKSIQPFVNRLTISNINLRNNTHQNEDLWHAISSLNNLVNVELRNVFTEIPSKAFKIVDAQTQWRLRYFTHTSFAIDSHKTGIESIGSYAFYNLPNIEIINLQSNQLRSIGKYAFANEVPSDKKLTIRLSKNKINPNTFVIGSLSGSQRPIKLQLGLEFVGCNRDLKYLEEPVFSAFLDKDGNELDIGCSFTMQCDCKMKWLYDAPTFWRNRVKSGSFGDIVIPCKLEGEEEDEEVSIWDLPEDYFDCDTNNRGGINLIENETVKNDLENFIDDFISYL